LTCLLLPGKDKAAYVTASSCARGKLEFSNLHHHAKMKPVALTTLCLCLGLSSLTHAREPSFVSAEETHALQILLAPPAAQSDKTRAELAELHRFEATRSDVQKAAAMADDKEESIFIFKQQLGDWFNAQTLPQTATFGMRVKNDEGINTAPAKTGFARVRPYNLDTTLHPICATKTKDDAYPSGHATTGYLMALTLIDVLPDKRDAILNRADDYANNRLVCGVHYRSDIEASKLLAYTIHAVMANKPQYQQELLAVRAEVQRNQATPAK
jgi:acid phosphatase (class A)